MNRVARRVCDGLVSRATSSSNSFGANSLVPLPLTTATSSIGRRTLFLSFQRPRSVFTRVKVNGFDRPARVMSGPAKRIRQIANTLSDARTMATAASLKAGSSDSKQSNPGGPQTRLPNTDVFSRKLQSARVFVLNRPKALNSLTLQMVYQMLPQLQVWETADLCKVIVLTSGEGSKAFCAGGDVKAVVQDAQEGPEGFVNALKFFEEEYRLNHLIGTLTKPFVAIMNGITMGGGVGLSVHAPFRVATENTVFAMPETAIGLFPDVGGSFFLPRLDGELGTYLGITGKQLKGEEVFFAGIGTHYIPSARLPMLMNRLAELETSEIEAVNMVLEEFVAETSISKWRNWSLGGKVLEAIQKCFRFNSLEEIIAELEATAKGNSNATTEVSKWAGATLETMKTMSPTSMKVTLEQLRRGRKKNFAECFQQEFRLVQQCLRSKDFIGGVAHKLINKSKEPPTWSISWEEMSKLTPEVIDALYFSNEVPGESGYTPHRLELGRAWSYFDYPHRPLSGLPTELDVYRAVQGRARKLGSAEPKTKQEVLEFFLLNWGGYDASMMGPYNLRPRITIEGGFGRGKVGLVEKVTTILESRCDEQQGKLSWTGPLPYDPAPTV
ncbi:ClpP/crotonase-like domain-containing protein [Cladochytrium replicatum]|nr:ClpP/crotonase-like domain-containing protein [Cladochytrium replicatum]